MGLFTKVFKYDDIDTTDVPQGSDPQSGSSTEYTVCTDFEMEEYGVGQYILTKYIGFDEENIEIPAVINGKPIAAIGEGHFAQNKVLRNVKLNEGIVAIKENAFAESGVESVVLPNSLSEIGEAAFMKTPLKQVALPNGLAYIHERAFSWCQSLELLSFPEKVEYLGENCFANCPIYPLQKLPETLRYLGGGTISRWLEPCETLRLPEGLLFLGHAALIDLKCKTLILPAGIKRIESGAVIYSDTLEEIRFEPGCTAELIGIIHSCKNLKAVYIPDSITVLDEVFSQIEETTAVAYQYDRFGRHIYDENGLYAVNQERTYTTVRDTAGEELVIYCQAGSAAMAFARKKGYKLAKWDI